MSEPFIGEIRIFAGNFAPRGWTFCNGQLLQIAQNTALFAVVGTTYGGDGRSTLGLPNLQGRAPMHPGNGLGLTPRRLGENGGAPTAAITDANMPDHNHTMKAAFDGLTPGEDRPAVGNSMAFSTGGNMYQTNTTANLVDMHNDVLPDVAGGTNAHNNMQPYLGIYFIIALEGTFPSRG